MGLIVTMGIEGVGVALGVLAAGRAGPQACGWPSLAEGVLLQRMAGLFARAPGRRRRAVGAMVVAGLIAAGGMAAYAAAPASVPDSLPSQVAGVVGSGEKLSLRLTGSDGARTVVVGEEIGDGWKLSGLTPTKATLSKGDQSREVGLNPTGALASAEQQGTSLVDVLNGVPTLTDLTNALLRFSNSSNATDKIVAMTQVNAARLATGMTVGGLDADQSRRFTEMSDKIEARRLAIRQGEAPALPFFSDDMRWSGPELIASVLGPDAAEYNAYLATIDDNSSIGAQRADRQNNPVAGPSTYYLLPGDNRVAVMAEAGVDPRGTWVASPRDTDGGVTFTRISEFNGTQQGRNMSQAQSALDEAGAIAKGADPARYGLTPAGAAQLLATLPASVRAAAGQ